MKKRFFIVIARNEVMWQSHTKRNNGVIASEARQSLEMNEVVEWCHCEERSDVAVS